MLDGSAMCGGCKVSKKTGELGSEDFACHGGPDRFAQDVNLDELISRLSIYQTEEADVIIFHIKRELRKMLAPEPVAV
jgi:hypothetical protein